MSAIPQPQPQIKIRNLGNHEVKFYNDEHFAKLRKRYNVPDDLLSESNFDFENMKAGGGKGGDPMTRTTDQRFFVKEVKDCDHDSLIENTPSLVEHTLRGSFVCRIFFHFHVKHHHKDYMVMNSWLPDNFDLPLYRLMDLKGTADDKTIVKDGERIVEIHKRFWKLHMNFSCCRSDARNAYYTGKKEAFNFEFNVSPTQKNEILKSIALDVRYFQDKGLMDYSFIVAIYKVPKASYQADTFPKLIFDERQPYISERGGNVYAMYMGIIDYLQPWNTAKKIAHCIKCTFAPKPISTVEPRFYGDQFARHFNNHVLGNAMDVAAPKEEKILVEDQDNNDEPRPLTFTSKHSSVRAMDIVYISEV